MSGIEKVNLGLRAVMEAGVVVGFGVWGWHAGGATWSRALLAVVAPLVGFGFWGAVDFRGAGRWAEGLRLVQELAISLLAGAGLMAAGWPAWGWALVGISVVYHGLVYASGARLLRGDVH